jgi:hypothetical protein
MSRDDIINLARQSGLAPEWMPSIAHPQMQHLERFAALVAAAEREAILQMSADNWFKTQWAYDEAIRARGQA